MKKFEEIFKKILKKIEPSKEDLDFIDSYLKKFIKTLENAIKKRKINADIFIGGSYAKKTLIKKDSYDIDVFLRFDKKYEDKKISEITGDLLSEITNFDVIHGSRDYFNIKIGKNFFIEIVPVKKIDNPKDSENITDLSYAHVKYIKSKIKSKKAINEIKLAKAFCYAKKCYGAESYINGFSGYSLELLIYKYKSFLNFVKAIARIGKEKEIIDIEKKYKNKREILLNLNSSKIKSPIVLIDPTYPRRNALAALSEETFTKFREECRKFIKNPSINDFEIKKIDVEKLKNYALKRKNDFIFIEISTAKQEGDIAGSKLIKFYRHLIKEVEKYFNIKNKEFEYSGKKTAVVFFEVKKKEFILYKGPLLKDIKNSQAFIKSHKNIFHKNRRIYAKEEISFDLRKFIEFWKNKYSKKIKEMGIEYIKII